MAGYLDLYFVALERFELLSEKKCDLWFKVQDMENSSHMRREDNSSWGQWSGLPQCSLDFNYEIYHKFINRRFRIMNCTNQIQFTPKQQLGEEVSLAQVNAEDASQFSALVHRTPRSSWKGRRINHQSSKSDIGFGKHARRSDFRFSKQSLIIVLQSFQYQSISQPEPFGQDS